MKTVCIYHRVDLDGWMSAAIVKHWFIENHRDGLYFITIDGLDVPDDISHLDTLTFLGYHYGDPIPDLSEYDQVIMCDVSFPPDYMKHLVDKLGTNFIWLDHHISAINSCPSTLSYVNNLGKLIPVEGIRDVNFAACELTWKYFMSNPIDKFFETEEQCPMPEIVRLLGRYDCFGHKGTDEEQKVLEFQYGARAIITNYEKAYNWLLDVIHDNKHTSTKHLTVNFIYNLGESIYLYLCTEAKQIYKNGFTIILQEPDYLYKNPTNKQYFNRSFICFNKERFNPINFGIDYHKDGYDGAACFWYANGMWNFSLRNDNGLVDCSMIAKHYGGGGHKGAAGFSIKDLKTIIK